SRQFRHESHAQTREIHIGFWVITERQLLGHQVGVLLADLDVGLWRVHVVGGLQLTALGEQERSRQQQDFKEAEKMCTHGLAPTIYCTPRRRERKTPGPNGPGGVREEYARVSEPCEALASAPAQGPRPELPHSFRCEPASASQQPPVQGAAPALRGFRL